MGEFVYIHFRIKRRCIKHAVHQSIKIREIIMRHASLNRIYRLIWSHIHQTWVIVSERTRGKGKSVNRKLLAATLLATSQLVLAGPMDGQVTAGTGVISQQSNTTTVTQSSQNMSLTWGSFNTAGNEIVNFVQPSASAIAVNRIFDTNATQFFGQLNANGQVYLINPNGVVFGAGSQINVGGLVASTLDINDAALSSTTRNFTGTGTGSIINHGSINTVNGGYVAFLGNRVSNQGNINAPQGTVALGAGNDVTLSFSGDSLVTLQINQSTLDNLAENGALIKADGGAVWMSAGAKDTVLASVVNNTGIIQARSAQNVNGVIVLEAGSAGTANNSGTLNASGISTGETGGTVKVLGDTVNLAAGSTIDVSGDAGGGTTLIGGNFLGTGPEHNAQTTIVAAGASINANAITTGTGGSVAVWSDGKTQFDGSITARGGSTAGNGGQVETSGKQLLIGSTAEVNTSAASGTSGTWLLDPEDVVIGNLSYWGNTYGITVDSLVLTRALNQGNVVIKTTNGVASCSNITCSGNSNQNGDITILDTIGAAIDVNNGGQTSYWNTGNYTLTLSAYRDIKFANTAAIDASIHHGAIDLSQNMLGGHVILKADNTATGTGTVKFSNLPNNFIAIGNANSTVSIYYNAGSSYSPTDYTTGLRTSGGAASSQLNAYMAININGATASKVYDGNTVATLSGQTVAPTGLTVDSTNATATFADKNVGTNKTVTIDGITVTGNGATTSIKTNTDGTQSTVITYQGNTYYLNGLTNDTGTITKADLRLSGTKVYDGSTAILGSTLVATGVNGETFSVIGTGDSTNLSSKNVQSTSLLNSTTGLSLGSSSNGGLSSNYNVLSTIGSAYTVTAKGITLTGITASDKVYDATTSATLNTSNVGYSGMVIGDVFTLSGSGVGTFDTKDVGTGKTVTVRGYTLSGTDAGNYVVTQPTGLTAKITKADLVVSGISATDKIYDGSTAASLTGTASVTALLSDLVSLTGTGAGSFTDANAEANKTVTVTGLSLTGRDANNYNLIQPDKVTASINKANLTLNGTKVYDGSTIIAGNTLVATGVNGETFSVIGTGDSTNLSSKNVQTNSQFNSVTGLSLGSSSNGGLSSNYNVLSTIGSAYTVTAKGITLTGIRASDKVYDATTSATLDTSNVDYSGMITGDVVTLSGSGVGTFDTKDVGTGKTVTVRGYTLSGTDAGNYVITQPSGLTASISKANLLLTGLTTSDKVYDATTTALLNGTASLSSAIGNDVVMLSGSGQGNFETKHVGNNKDVIVSGYTLSGTDAKNYNIVVDSSGLTANITPASITISGITANDKTFDGTTSASINTDDVIFSGKFGTDQITVSSTGTFTDESTGQHKTVNLNNVFGGTDVQNYIFTDQLTTTASITGSAAPSNDMQQAITQLQTSILPPHISMQPQFLTASSTVKTNNVQDDDLSQFVPSPVFVPIGFGTSAPSLNIQHGGVQLPPMATNIQ
jgi:filamentous hemagglutinin family protein